MKKLCIVVFTYTFCLFSLQQRTKLIKPLEVTCALLKDTFIVREEANYVKVKFKNISLNPIDIIVHDEWITFISCDEQNNCYKTLDPFISYSLEAPTHTLYPQDTLVIYQNLLAYDQWSSFNYYLKEGRYRVQANIMFYWKYLYEERKEENFKFAGDTLTFGQFYVVPPPPREKGAYTLLEETLKKIFMYNRKWIKDKKEGRKPVDTPLEFRKNLFKEFISKYPNSFWSPSVRFAILENNSNSWISFIEDYPNFVKAPSVLSRLVNIKYNILYRGKHKKFYETHKTIPPLPKEPGWDKEKTVNYLKSLIKRFPGTRIAKRAEEILKEIEEGGK